MGLHDIVVTIHAVGVREFNAQTRSAAASMSAFAESNSAASRKVIADGEKVNAAQAKFSKEREVRARQDRLVQRQALAEQQAAAMRQFEIMRAQIGAQVQAGQRSIASGRAQLAMDSQLLTVEKERAQAALALQRAEATRAGNARELRAIAVAEAQILRTYEAQLSTLQAQNITLAKRNTSGVGPRLVMSNAAPLVQEARVAAAAAEQEAAAVAKSTTLRHRLNELLTGTGPGSANPHDVRRSAFGMFLVGGALIAGVGASVVAFGRFEQQMRNVSSIAQYSGKQLEYMSHQVLSVSRGLPITAKDAAEALYNIVSSGVGETGQKLKVAIQLNQDLAAQLTVLKVSARAASAGLTDANTSARAIVAVMNAYGESAGQAAKISDVLFQTVNVGVLSFEELTQQLGDFVAFGAQAGISLDQLGIAMAAITRAGVPAAEASTSLNRVLQAFIKPSKEMSAQLSQLGFQHGEVATKTVLDLQQATKFNQMLGLSGDKALQAGRSVLTLAQIMEILRQKNGGSITQLQKLFPEIRAARGAMALWANDGQNLANVVERFNETMGATGRALREQQKGLAYQFQIFKNNMTAAFIDIGKGAETPIKMLMALIGGLAHSFSSLPQPIKTMTGILAGGAGLILVAAAGYAALATSLSRLFVMITARAPMAAAALTRLQAAVPWLLAIAAVVTAATLAWGYYKKQQEDINKLVPDVEAAIADVNARVKDQKQRVDELGDSYGTLAAQNGNISGAMDRFGLKASDVGRALAGTGAEYRKFTDDVGNSSRSLGEKLGGLFTGDTLARFRLVRDMDKFRESAKLAQEQLSEDAAVMRRNGGDAKNTADKIRELGGNTEATATATAKLTTEQKELQKSWENILDLPGVFEDMNRMLYAGAKTPQEAFTDAAKSAIDAAKQAQKSADADAKAALKRRSDAQTEDAAIRLQALKDTHSKTLGEQKSYLTDLKRVQSSGFYSASTEPGSIDDQVAAQEALVSKTKATNKQSEEDLKRHTKVNLATFHEYAGGVRVSLDQFIKSLNDQADEQESYYTDMQRIASVTKSDGGKFVDALRNMGADAQPLIASLADSTDDGIRKVMEAFDRLTPSADKVLQSFTDTVIKHTAALAAVQKNIQILTARGFGDVAQAITTQGKSPDQIADVLSAAATANEQQLQGMSQAVSNAAAAVSDSAVTQWVDVQRKMLDAIYSSNGDISLSNLAAQVKMDPRDPAFLKDLSDMKSTLETNIPGLKTPKKLLFELQVAMEGDAASDPHGSASAASLTKIIQKGVQLVDTGQAFGKTPLFGLWLKMRDAVEPQIREGIKNGTIKGADDATNLVKKAFTREELEWFMLIEDPQTHQPLYKSPGGIQGYFARTFGLEIGKPVQLGLYGPDGKPINEQEGIDNYIKDPDTKPVPLNPVLAAGAKSVQQLLMAYGIPNVDVSVGLVKDAVSKAMNDVSGVLGGVFSPFAQGGVVESHHAQIAPAGAMRVWAEPETGGEAYIPLSQQKRGRSVDILQTVADKFGYGLHKFAQGGILNSGGDVSALAGVRPNEAVFSKAAGQLATGLLAGLARVAIGAVGGSGFLGTDPGQGGVGVNSVRTIEQIMAQSGLPAIITSEGRAGSAGFHGSGNAVDFGWAGNDPAGLIQIANFWSRYSGGLLELIYDNGWMGNVKNGQRVGDGMSVYGAATMADHNDHVHVAATLDSLHKIFTGAFAPNGAAVPHGSSNQSNSAAAIGQRMAAARGWVGPEWTSLYSLWQGESNWNPMIVNGGSGAYGIPQILPSAHGHPVALGDAPGQIAWGLNYIAQRYGDPINAYSTWLSRSPHWYSAGGVEDHQAQMSGGNVRVWGEPETGGEAYIPMSSNKRAGAMGVLSNVARRFGYGLQHYADGGVNFSPLDLSRGGGSGGFFNTPGDIVRSATSVNPTTGAGGGFNLGVFIKNLNYSAAVYGDWSRKLGIVTKRAGADVSDMLRQMGADGRDAINALVSASDTDIKKIVGNLRLLGATAQNTGSDLGYMLDQATGSLRDQQEFEKDLLSLAQRNYVNLAMQIQSMGVEQGLPLARAAVSTKNGLQLVGLELSIAGAQNLLGDDLQTGLKIMQLISSGHGKTGIHAVASAMQLSEADVVKLLQKGLLQRVSALPGGAGAKVASDYVKATHGQAYAAGGYQAGIARGLRVFGEPETGGEAYIPLAMSKRHGAVKVLRQVMQHFGYDEYANGGIRLPMGAQMGGIAGGGNSQRVIVVRVEGGHSGSVPPIGQLNVTVPKTNASAQEIVQEAYWMARTAR